MSNLKELVWKNGDTCSHIKVSAKSPLHGYFVSQASGNDEISVGYYENSGKATRYATGFTTIADAKAWAWNHYNEKMQPYVKPSPTWIDVNDRLPESECFYLVRLFDGHRDEHVFVILWWNSEHQQFLEWDAMCEPTHWMPIPEFSTMQNLHKTIV